MTQRYEIGDPVLYVFRLHPRPPARGVVESINKCVDGLEYSVRFDALGSQLGRTAVFLGNELRPVSAIDRLGEIAS